MLEPDFQCECGRRFYVAGRPGRYQCVSCQITITFGKIETEIVVGESESDYHRRVRQARVRARVEHDRRTERSIRQRARPGEGYGSAVDRLEQSARRFGRNELADRLLSILQICGCDRQVAVERLNAQLQATDG